METELMQKVAEVAPDKYQYLLDTADEVKAGPFCEEIVGALDGILKKAAFNFGQVGQVAKRVGVQAAKGSWGVAKGLSGMALAGVGMALAGDMYDVARRGLTKTRNYRAMLEANPDLKDRPAAQVQSIFSTLHRFNPDFAGDPLVAGSFVRNHADMAGAEHGAVDMNVLTNLVGARKNLTDTKKLPGLKLGK